MRNKKKLECMEFSVKLLRMVGCWPIWRRKDKSERLYHCYSMIVFAILFIYLLILTYGLTIYYKTWTLEEAVEDLIVFATALIVIFKLLLLLWNQPKLQDFINHLNHNLNKRHIQDEEDENVVKSCIKHEKSLTKTYVFFGYCITVLYTTSSIIRIIRQRSSDTYTLPLKYPFHPKMFPLYHITYLHQLLVMILNGHIGTVADTFFSCLTYYMCGHFKIIKSRIAKDTGTVTKNFVNYHNEIISLIQKLQSIFGPFLMFQLTSTSLLICLGLVQITETKNINLLHYMKCVIYVTIKLSQLFLYCWYGQEVIQTSCSVSFGAYFGTWNESRDRKTADNLKIVLLRSQKPVEIRAGNYFIVSLPTLASVMNTAYSFFTMLNSFQKNSQ